MVGDVGLCIYQGLPVSLAMNELTLSQSQTPLLYMKDDWVWQMALHDEQRTENHLKQFHMSEMLRPTGAHQQHRLLTTLCCT